MSINAFKDTYNNFIPIRRYQNSTVPTTSTPFAVLGDELLVNGVWYKSTAYNPTNGFTWKQLTDQSGTSTGGITFYVVTTSTTALANSCYLVQQNGSPITITLPASAPVGTIVSVIAFTNPSASAATNIIVQSAGSQYIQLGNTITSAGGSIKSTIQNASANLVCAVTNSLWVAVSFDNAWVSS